MQTALRVKTTILAGGKIEIADPQLRSGEIVEVIILLPEVHEPVRRAAFDILADAPGHRLFKTPAEVEAYIREKRDAWGS
ncbi:MAG: hypothetical protein IPO81_30300 [Kouleothrix sp.]|nr:hypothetical protein [Kouleothrix sp.]